MSKCPLFTAEKHQPKPLSHGKITKESGHDLPSLVGRTRRIAGL